MDDLGMAAALKKAAMTGEVAADPQQEPDAPWTPLSSSSIQEARYKGAEGRMEVLFTTGQVYSYECPRAVFDQLLAASSPGRFFRDNVRLSYRYRREA